MVAVGIVHPLWLALQIKGFADFWIDEHLHRQFVEVLIRFDRHAATDRLFESFQQLPAGLQPSGIHSF